MNDPSIDLSHSTAGSTYFETQIVTSTPQRLRLLLIQAALGTIEQCHLAESRGESAELVRQLTKLREIVGELLSAIAPGAGPIADQVAAIYDFIYREVVATHLDQKLDRLAALVPVLEEDRLTWQLLCEQLPERVEPTTALDQEILAPRFVAEIQNVTDTGTTSFGSHQMAGSSFSFDA